MTILCGSVVEYGPLLEPGGEVRAVVACEGAYEDSEYCDETYERAVPARGGAVAVRDGAEDAASSLPR
jgi:hypothetical protein